MFVSNVVHSTRSQVDKCMERLIIYGDKCNAHLIENRSHYKVQTKLIRLRETCVH